MINLKDPSLLKTKCLIDGQWIGDETHDVTNPANDEAVSYTHLDVYKRQIL